MKIKQCLFLGADGSKEVFESSEFARNKIFPNGKFAVSLGMHSMIVDIGKPPCGLDIKIIESLYYR